MTVDDIAKDLVFGKYESISEMKFQTNQEATIYGRAIFSRNCYYVQRHFCYTKYDFCFNIAKKHEEDIGEPEFQDFVRQKDLIAYGRETARKLRKIESLDDTQIRA